MILPKNSSRKTILSIILLVAISFFGCGEEADSSDKVIDYANLPEIPIEIEMEIVETDDYLPGNLSQVIEDEDGDLLITDRASISIDQFDYNGNYLRRIASEGEGPGELGQYFGVVYLGTNEFAVTDFNAGTMFFSKKVDGSYTFDSSFIPSEEMGRRFTLSNKLTDDAFFASKRMVFNLSSGNMNDKDTFREIWYALINSENEIVTDSVFMLKSPSMHMVRSGNSISLRSIPFRNEDQLQTLGNGRYLIARPDSSTITFYNENHEAEKVLELEITPRRITQEDIEFELDGVEGSPRTEIEALITDYKPNFLNIWATENHLFLYTSRSENHREVVVLDMEGNALGKITVPGEDTLEFFTDDKFYTIHSDEILGDQVRRWDIKF